MKRVCTGSQIGLLVSRLCMFHSSLSCVYLTVAVFSSPSIATGDQVAVTSRELNLTFALALENEISC